MRSSQSFVVRRRSRLVVGRAGRWSDATLRSGVVRNLQEANTCSFARDNVGGVPSSPGTIIEPVGGFLQPSVIDSFVA